SLYAARAYLERRGRPARPDQDLAGHHVILFADSPAFELENAWLAARTAGAHVVLRSASRSSLYAATVAGLGTGLLPRPAADGQPELERIPIESPPEPRHIWVGVHRDLARSPRVRAVLDFLSEVVDAGS